MKPKVDKMKHKLTHIKRFLTFLNQTMIIGFTITHMVFYVAYHAHSYMLDDVIKWKHFPRYWPFERGIHRPPVNSPQKGQWRGALMFSLICVWINGWVNNRETGDLRCYRAHYDVTRIVFGNTWWSHSIIILCAVLNGILVHKSQGRKTGQHDEREKWTKSDTLYLSLPLISTYLFLWTGFAKYHFVISLDPFV